MKTSAHSMPLILVALTASLVRAATTVTLMDVQDGTATPVLPTPLVTYSPIGVGPNGATSYLVKEVVTAVPFPQGTTTITVPTRITGEATWVGDASHFVYSYVTSSGSFTAGGDVSCDIQGTSGSCADVFWAPQLTTTVGWTGNVVPVATVVSNGGSKTTGTGLSSIARMGTLFGAGVLVGVGLLV